MSKSMKRSAAVLAAVVGLSFVAGCAPTSDLGAATDLKKGFIDPTAVGRFQQQPLVVPILSSLDRSIDVDVDQFRDATDVQPEDLTPSDQDYAIGRNDLISIAITDLVAPNVETIRTNRVSESGMISLPLIGQVKAAGLTEAELEEAIAEAYRKANLMEDAQVSVSVAEARARTFSILGSVTAPGQYAILNSEFRVLDALVLARDVSAQGVEYIYVIRPLSKSQPADEKPKQTQPAQPEDVLTPQGALQGVNPIMAQASATTAKSAPLSADEQKFITVEGKQLKVTPQGQTVVKPAPAATAKTTATSASPAAAKAPVTAETTTAAESFEFQAPVSDEKTRVIRIPYEALRRGELRYNIIIKPYDMIVVSQPVVGEFYMGGHVARPGVYSLTARKLTLKQAIVSAGMFDAIAVPARTEIVRRVGEDQEVFVNVNLDKVFAGQQPDIFLKPYDLVKVGTSWWAPFLASVRGGFRAAYGFGFLYDRNYGDEDDNN